MIDHIYLPVTDLKRSDTFYGGMRLRPSADNLFLYKSGQIVRSQERPIQSNTGENEPRPSAEK
jgi:hypothetical protein